MRGRKPSLPYGATHHMGWVPTERNIADTIGSYPFGRDASFNWRCGVSNGRAQARSYNAYRGGKETEP
ncbi:hypothetical protein GCM10009552_39630 [Rothia nasimurium]